MLHSYRPGRLQLQTGIWIDDDSAEEKRKARKKPVARVRHSSTSRIEEIMIYEKMHAVKDVLQRLWKKSIICRKT